VVPEPKVRTVAVSEGDGDLMAESGIAQDRRSVQLLLWAFIAGAGIGVLGGMIGLGGAEFRLPLLIAAFGFAALAAVIMNKAMSLIVVVTALPARLLVHRREPAGWQPGGCLAGRDVGNQDAVSHALSGPGGAAGLDRRRLGVEPLGLS
jgi:hypothetical protein